MITGRRILILGGTTEARELAGELAGRGFAVRISLAGRTAQIRDQGVPVRVGGFGGAAGLAEYLVREGVAALIDATHPYAAVMSQHAAEAARAAGVPLLALHRPAWTPGAGDRWREVANVEQAVAALGTEPRRVFLALGRKELEAFAAAPQHAYLVRSVDPVDPPLGVPRAVYVTARGPFDEADERRLLEQHAIEHLVCRNSGGPAAQGKLAAARALGIPVLLIRRPPLPDVPAVSSPAEVVAWLAHAPSR